MRVFSFQSRSRADRRFSEFLDSRTRAPSTRTRVRNNNNNNMYNSVYDIIIIIIIINWRACRPERGRCRARAAFAGPPGEMSARKRLYFYFIHIFHT